MKPGDAGSCTVSPPYDADDDDFEDGEGDDEREDGDNNRDLVSLW